MRRRTDTAIYDQMNLTPLMDLAWCLLIIFMVMATAAVQGIMVNLPKAGAAPSLAKPKTRSITVTDDGRIYLDTSAVTLRELEDRLQQYKAETPDLPVVIRGDAHVQLRTGDRCAGRCKARAYHRTRPGHPTARPMSARQKYRARRPLLPRFVVRLLVLVPFLIVVLLARHYVMHSQPHARADVQRVTLLEQTRSEPLRRPPDPEPQKTEPAPEPEPRKTPSYSFEELKAAGPPQAPGPAPLGPLGVQEEGAGSGDAFGLASRQGGRDITTLGDVGEGGTGRGGEGTGGGSILSIYGGYAMMVRDVLRAELAERSELHGAYYSAVVAVWVAEDGRIRRVDLEQPTGIGNIDTALRAAVQLASTVDRPPPPDMPQPIRLRIVSHSP
ncbi:MAG: biopolymer transporter ExbD [Rhodospirillales bacterium]